MKRKREHRLIAFKAFFDTDEDIVRWWESMAEGERSDVIRDLLRGYLKGLPMVEAAQRKQVPVDGNTVRQLYDETVWIRAAIADLPGQVERLLGRMTVYSAPQVTAQPLEPPPTEALLSDEELARRKARLVKATW